MFLPDIRQEQPRLLIPGAAPTGSVTIDRLHPLAPLVGGNHLRLWGGLKYVFSTVASTDIALGAEYWSFLTDLSSAPTSYQTAAVCANIPDNPFLYNTYINRTWRFKIAFPSGGPTAGPALLWDQGGSTNGISFIYRTGPNRFAVYASVGGTKTEDQFAYDFAANGYESGNPFEVAFSFDGTTWRMYVEGIEAASVTATHATLVTGTSGSAWGGQDQGIYGSASQSAFAPVVATNILYPLNGYYYYWAIHPLLTTNQIRLLARDPYQFLIPA